VADFSLLDQETAIKPGRPLMVAQRKGTLFFGMPGYPVAFLTNALLYLVPAEMSVFFTECKEVIDLLQ